MTYLSGRAKKRTTLFRYGVFVIVVAGLLMAWLSIKKIIHPVTVPILTFYAGTRESFSMFPEFFRGYLTSHTTLLKEQQDHMAKIAMLENLLAEKEGLLIEA